MHIISHLSSRSTPCSLRFVDWSYARWAHKVPAEKSDLVTMTQGPLLERGRRSRRPNTKQVRLNMDKGRTQSKTHYKAGTTDERGGGRHPESKWRQELPTTDNQESTTRYQNRGKYDPRKQLRKAHPRAKTPAGATEDYVAIGRRNPSDGQTKASAVRDVGEEGALQDLKSAITSKK